MSETAQLDPEPRSPEPRTESNQLRLCLLTHMWLLFIACRVCVALSGIALAGIALAVIALDGPSFSYPLPGRPPPFRASAVAPRCLALHRVWVRLCGRCGVTVLVCCIRPPAFSIALPAPAIAWARTAARQCCLK